MPRDAAQFVGGGTEHSLGIFTVLPNNGLFVEYVGGLLAASNEQNVLDLIQHLSASFVGTL